ncbi:MAG: hypothetical protein MMC33_010270 [Icmadophila ericetorum]|nr:hypothetical protein [Icmadophila ericetorum]
MTPKASSSDLAGCVGALNGSQQSNSDFDRRVRHRRSNLKSRNGCAQCKKRKIKVQCQYIVTRHTIRCGKQADNFEIQCNEETPSCGACTKSRLHCSFKPITPPATPASAFASSSTNLAGTLSDDQLLNLELLHNYSTKTYATLSDRDGIRELYQTNFVTEGLSHDFLIHGILSTSAFHLGYGQQQKYQSYLSQHPLESHSEAASLLAKARLYFLAAHTHYNTALSSFRANLAAITPSNSNALFACSTVILVAALARPRHLAVDDGLTDDDDDDDGDGDDGTAKAIEWLHLVRGTASVLEPTRPWIIQGSMRLLTEWEPDRDSQAIGEDTSSQLKQLSLFIAKNPDQVIRRSCEEAIDKLRSCFIWATKKFYGITYTFSWPAMVSAEYMTLLSLRSPEALMILAHYCVLLYRFDHFWYVHGWAGYTVKAIYRNLEEEWRKWIEWPMTMIGIDTAACMIVADRSQLDYRPV